jgi:predicted metal-binding membrane protein
MAWAALAWASIVAWVMLIALSLRAAQTRPPGGGLARDGLLGAVPSVPLPDFFESLLALCLTPIEAGGSSSGRFLAVVAMWFLMAVAMMLPSAAPMLKTYCEIADTAAGKGEPAVHPLILLAGYLAAWIAAAAAFAALDFGFGAFARSGPLAPAEPYLAAAMLTIAGLYQFSALKQACLKKCRMPFPVLFARWSVRPGAIFRLGLDEGFWCVGCCWALMLVMFAVGVMNPFWMVLLALFATVEKQLSGQLASRAAGTILLVWAGALLFTAG